MKSLSLICLSIIAFLPATWAQSGHSTTIDIKEWKVPWSNTRPRDPDVTSDGNIWFVGQRGDYIARFNPQTEDFKKYELQRGAGPHNLVIDSDGSIWFTANLAGYIGHMNPDDGSIKKFQMPNSRARDPHTLYFGKDNDIWFTVQGGNFIGRLYKDEQTVDLIEVPTSGARPYGIVVDENNRPWINLLGTNKLATVDPQSMKLEEIPLPRNEARSRRIAMTSDGLIWYDDYAQGYIGRFNPDTREFKEWALPDGNNSRPYALARDHQDRIWVVETGVQPNKFVGFNPASEEFFSITEIESGGGSVRNMVFYPETKMIWFGTDTNYLGAAHVDNE